MMHIRKTLVLLVGLGFACALLVSAVSAQQNAATFTAGGATVAVQADGCMAVRDGGRELISGIRLTVAAPGWRTTVSQADGHALEGYPRREDGAFVLRGEMTETGSGTVWQFDQRVVAEGDAIRVTYALQPMADTEVAEASVLIVPYGTPHELTLGDDGRVARGSP